MNLPTPPSPSIGRSRPLRTLFVITSMPIGGAETLLVNLVRNFDPSRVKPALCCLKELGPLGEVLKKEIPTYDRLLGNKFDLRVWPRLNSILKNEEIDAVVTVGAGDKMFWGRLAAWRAGVPVILSALHSTGWPDTIGRLNRRLTSITDGFIAVASDHGRYLHEVEGFPEEKVHVIPNGVDTDRFQSNSEVRHRVRQELGLSPETPVCGIVAALRSEKNHTLFLEAASRVTAQLPDAQFLIVGDGPERKTLEEFSTAIGIAQKVHFLGSRSDIPELLCAMDVFSLTSHNEANPVSILEALATEVPVVATNVGSIAETVLPDQTGFLADPGDASAISEAWLHLLRQPAEAARFGANGRKLVVDNASLNSMVEGYQSLIERIFLEKCGVARRSPNHESRESEWTSVI